MGVVREMAQEEGFDIQADGVDWGGVEASHWHVRSFPTGKGASHKG